MFPNAANTSLDLISIVGIPDKLGNKRLVIKDSKKVVGITKSITSSEFQTAVMLNVKYDFKVVVNARVYTGAKYAGIGEKIYKIERTYLNGIFLELYLSLTEYKKEELIRVEQLR